MRSIPPTYQTLFADLQQRLQWAEIEPGSVYVQKPSGKVYVKRRIGAAYVSEYLGPPKDPNTEAKVAAIKAANEQRRERRQLVQTLKAAGLPGPTLAMGHILEAIAAAGLFNPPAGLVVVGTTAFATYAPLIGEIPAAQALITQDIDLALIELAVAGNRPGSLHAALARAGVEMRPEGAYTPPARLTGGGLTVEFLTPLRRGGEPVAQAPGLGVSAQTLPFLDFLIADPIPIAVLHGPGVLVRVPQPARYAVHKMLIANRRPAGDPKVRKDLDQARQIIEAMTASGQVGAMDDARAIAEARGAKWRRALEASERAMQRQTDDAAPAALMAIPAPRTR